MGCTWTLGCFTALLLVLLSSAVPDELDLGQREVTFDIGEIMQEKQIPDSLLIQRELDLSELFNYEDFPLQQIISYVPKTGTTDRPSIRPRSNSGPPALDYHVQFPLSKPTEENLEAICLHGDHRPRYPDSYFPDSGFGQLKRRATAVNRAESWFASCCRGNQTWGREATLCCATQAWELSVKMFCQEDSSVKDHLYNCCKLRGNNRLNCFIKDAPNPNYDPTEMLPMEHVPFKDFNFDNSSCQRTNGTPYTARANRGRQQRKLPTSKKVDINFPPGRPTAHNLKSICRNQMFRPLYNIKCLPAVGYEAVARQAKTVNHLEHAFKKCCKKKTGLFICAHLKWRAVMNRFCAGQNADFPCCTAEKPEDRLRCFESASPDPHYNLTSTSENITLNKICGTHKIIKKRFPVGFALKTFVSKCCPLSEEDKTTCIMHQVMEVSKNQCRKKNRPLAIQRCCALPSHETPHCISKIMTESITKAVEVQKLKMRKRCPLS